MPARLAAWEQAGRRRGCQAIAVDRSSTLAESEVERRRDAHAAGRRLAPGQRHECRLRRLHVQRQDRAAKHHGRSPRGARRSVAAESAAPAAPTNGNFALTDFKVRAKADEGRGKPRASSCKTRRPRSSRPGSARSPRAIDDDTKSAAGPSIRSSARTTPPSSSWPSRWSNRRRHDAHLHARLQEQQAARHRPAAVSSATSSRQTADGRSRRHVPNRVAAVAGDACRERTPEQTAAAARAGIATVDAEWQKLNDS